MKKSFRLFLTFSLFVLKLHNCNHANNYFVIRTYLTKLKEIKLKDKFTDSFGCRRCHIISHFINFAVEQCSLTSPFVWQWSKLFSHFLAPQTSWEEPSEFSNAQWGQSYFEVEFTFRYNPSIFSGFEFRNRS